MGNSAPRSVPAAAAWANEPCDAAAVAERQRLFEFLDSIDPGRSFRWIQHAGFMCRSGGGAERARPVFRAALSRVADYETVYSAWTNMEEWEGAAAAARELYEEWRTRRAADGGERGPDADSWFWRRYLQFELSGLGDADRARAVAAAAMAACPRDFRLRAKCVLAEARLGDDERARAAFDRAVADFAGDADAERRLKEEVRSVGSYLSNKMFGGCFMFCRGWFFRPLRWWEQI